MIGYCDIAPGCEWHGLYHDTEYGFPTDDEAALFERLVLEINQAGLSWLTILKKRAGFVAAFERFDVDKVANYGDCDRARLLDDPGIIRNKLKVNAAIHNAGVIRELRASQRRERERARDGRAHRARPPPRGQRRERVALVHDAQHARRRGARARRPVEHVGENRAARAVGEARRAERHERVNVEALGRERALRVEYNAFAETEGIEDWPDDRFWEELKARYPQDMADEI